MQRSPPQEIPELQMAHGEEGIQEHTSLHPPVLMLLARHPLLTTANSGYQGKEICGLTQYSRSSVTGTDLSSPYLPERPEAGNIPITGHWDDNKEMRLQHRI